MVVGDLLPKFNKMWRFVAYRVLPEILVGVHTVIVLWIMIGTVVIFFDRGYIGTHLILISIVMVLSLFLKYCPLTKIEEKLRQQRDASFTLDNSFMTFYINKILRTNFSSSQVNNLQILVFIFSYAAAAVLYFMN